MLSEKQVKVFELRFPLGTFRAITAFMPFNEADKIAQELRAESTEDQDFIVAEHHWDACCTVYWLRSGKWLPE